MKREWLSQGGVALVLVGAALGGLALLDSGSRRIAALGSPVAEERVRALATLQPSDAPAQTLEHRLAALLHDASPEVREAAAQAAARLGLRGLAPEVEGAVLEGVRRGKSELWGSALAALASPGDLARMIGDLSAARVAPDSPASEALARAVLAAGPEADRELASAAIAAIHSNGEDAVAAAVLQRHAAAVDEKTLEALLLDPHDAVADAAAAALVTRGGSEDVAALASYAGRLAPGPEGQVRRERAARFVVEHTDATTLARLAHVPGFAASVTACLRDARDDASFPRLAIARAALAALRASADALDGDGLAAAATLLRRAHNALAADEQRGFPADAERASLRDAVRVFVRDATRAEWEKCARALGPAWRVLDDDDLARTKELLADPSARLRFIGLSAAVNKRGPDAWPLIEKLLQDPDPRVRLQLGVHCAWIGRPESLDIFADLVDDLDRRIADQARLNLAVVVGQEFEPGARLQERIKAWIAQHSRQLRIHPIPPDAPGAPSSPIVPR